MFQLKVRTVKYSLHTSRGEVMDCNPCVKLLPPSGVKYENNVSQCIEYHFSFLIQKNKYI